METAPVIETRGLEFRYPQSDLPALHDVDLSFYPGKITAVLGANGSGKTTLSRCLNALLTPTKGTVLVNGLSTSEPENTYACRSACSMVFQNPDNQLVASIVEDDVAFGPRNLGLSSAEIALRVNEALDAVGISSLAKAEVASLSGGQKQLAAIAGALAMRPKALVMDEPTSMLDPQSRARIAALCKQLALQGMAVILITHSLKEAREADWAIVFDQGGVALQGPSAEVLSQREKLKALDLLPDAPTACKRLVPQIRPVSEAPAIRLRDVGFSYGSEPVFSNLSFDVYAGEFLSIVGSCGCGKTTLLQLMNGLLTPDKGQVLSNGADTSKRKERRKTLCSCGLVFQFPERQLFAATTLEDVAFGPRNFGASKEQALQQARTAMQRVGLDPGQFASANPFRLSGGQQRRAALAGVLAMEPTCLLLDEPTAGLDPRGKEELLELLAHLNEEGLAVVMATHSMEDAARLSHRVTLLGDGRALLQGTPAEVFSRDNESLLNRNGLDFPCD